MFGLAPATDDMKKMIWISKVGPTWEYGLASGYKMYLTSPFIDERVRQIKRTLKISPIWGPGLTHRLCLICPSYSKAWRGWNVIGTLDVASNVTMMVRVKLPYLGINDKSYEWWNEATV